MEKKKTKQEAKKKTIRKSSSKVTSIEDILSQYDTPSRPFNPQLFSSLLNEFLQSYIIIGYTSKGDPVNITSAKSQQEIDALHTNLQRFIASFIMGGHSDGDEPDVDESDR